MRLFYSLGIFIYSLAIYVAAIFNAKAKAWVNGRKEFFKFLPDVIGKKVIWFHCASLGEFDMALPIMQEMKNRMPDHFLLVTFFSPSGMQHYHKRVHQANHVCYLPLDTKRNARKFVSHFSPKMAFFVKYEFWSNYIFEAKIKGVKVFSICTLLRKNQIFFKWYGGFFRKTLEEIDFFYTQDEQTTFLLENIGIMSFLKVGDARFDRVIQFKNNLLPNSHLLEFLSDEKAIVFGSTWPDDEALLIPFILRHTSHKFIIAPHDVTEDRIKEIESKLLGLTCRFTDKDLNKRILILNTIGHLSGAYSFGKWAYVGGGFSGKLHNILEPNVFGLPVVFGPKYNRFPEAMQFIEIGIAFSVSSLNELESISSNITLREMEIRTISSQNIHKNQGASSRIIEHLVEHFNF